MEEDSGKALDVLSTMTERLLELSLRLEHSLVTQAVT